MRNPPSAEGVPLWEKPNALRASQKYPISLIACYCSFEEGGPVPIHVLMNPLVCFTSTDFTGFLSRNSPLLWSGSASSCLCRTCTHLPVKCRYSELRNNRSWGSGWRSTSFLASAVEIKKKTVVKHWFFHYFFFPFVVISISFCTVASAQPYFFTTFWHPPDCVAWQSNLNRLWKMLHINKAAVLNY